LRRFLCVGLVCALLLAGCGGVQDPPTEETRQTVRESAAETTEFTGKPENRGPYDELGTVEVRAEDDSLPMAGKADYGRADSFSVWFQGTYQDLAWEGKNTGIRMDQMTEKTVTLENVFGLFAWDGLRYNCTKLTAADCYIPNIQPDGEDGILWLELSGDCYADGGGTDSCFEGFRTVVISGSGTLRLENVGLGCGGGRLPVPALVIDGPEVYCAFLGTETPRIEAETPTVFVRSGSLTVADYANIPGDMVISGGSFSTDLLIDTERLVARGGTAEITAWGGEAVPLLVVSGGELTCLDWLPEGTRIDLYAGHITARGIRYWDTLHIYGDGTFTDSQES